MDLSSIDMCFLLETVEKMKKKVAMFCEVKKQVEGHNILVNSFLSKQDEWQSSQLLGPQTTSIAGEKHQSVQALNGVGNVNDHPMHPKGTI